MIDPLRVFPSSLLSLRILCAITTSCFVEFFVRTKILILSWKTLLLKLLLFDRCTIICVLNQVKIAILKLEVNLNLRVNYADLWIVHTQVGSQLKGAKLKLKGLKALSLLLGACLECPKLKLELDTHSLKVKELQIKLLEKPHVSVTSPPCEVCGTLKGKLLHAIKENSELQQDVSYLSAHLKRTKLSEKMIEYDLNRVEENATKSTYKLGVGFERCEDMGEKSAPKFLPSSNYHKEEETLKSTKTH
jgi:hypothetical protein